MIIARFARKILKLTGSIFQVYGHRQGHAEFEKNILGRIRAPDGTYGILSADRADHARYRRLLSHEFSDRGMKVQQPVIVSYVDLLIEGLRSSSNQAPQDLVQWFNVSTQLALLSHRSTDRFLYSGLRLTLSESSLSATTSTA